MTTLNQNFPLFDSFCLPRNDNVANDQHTVKVSVTFPQRELATIGFIYC